MTVAGLEREGSEEGVGQRRDLLAGSKVALRPRHPDHVALLQEGLYNDVWVRAHADNRPWIPIPDGDASLSPYTITAVSENVSFFSVVTLDGELAGEALLWAIDSHNRLAHIGVALLPACRGRGLSVEVLQLLCRYGFLVRGLNRLQLETTASNQPMIRAAKSAGFIEEGRLREASWTPGSFADEVIMGLLAKEWQQA